MGIITHQGHNSQVSANDPSLTNITSIASCDARNACFWWSLTNLEKDFLRICLLYFLECEFSFHQMMGRKWSIVFCVFGRTGQARTSQARPGQMGCGKVDYNWGCVFSHLRFFWIKNVFWSGWSAKNGLQEGLGFNIESVFSHIFRSRMCFNPLRRFLDTLLKDLVDLPDWDWWGAASQVLGWL